jgi:hypothetical protein
MNLREETRVSQQARRGLEPTVYHQQATAQSQTQEALAIRTAALATRIREIPDGEADFAYEINLMGKVETVMQEARDILATPETGPTAIAAETEAIELLLSSKKINPKSRGGGGGSSPGGGGGGDTNQAALALLGSGINENEVREDRGIAQSTGEQPNSLPEEFRAGLDEYFNRLEELRGAP